MTKTHALRRLLEHGPMVVNEMVDCCRWDRRTVVRALEVLLRRGKARRAGVVVQSSKGWTYAYEATNSASNTGVER